MGCQVDPRAEEHTECVSDIARNQAKAVIVFIAMMTVSNGFPSWLRTTAGVVGEGHRLCFVNRGVRVAVSFLMCAWGAGLTSLGSPGAAKSQGPP